MSDERLIVPALDFGVPPAPVRFELPTNDGVGGTRFVSMGEGVTPAKYFDDVFTKVLQLIPAAQGTPYSLLAHGCNVLWVFTANARKESIERVSKLEARVEALATEVASLREENSKLRATTES
jgi:hypothetical protein